MLPKPLVQSIAEQIMEQWGMDNAPDQTQTLKNEVKITSQTRGGLIGPVFVLVTPDSGSTVSNMTDGSVKFLHELCSKNPSAHN
jgi:hypothetical protein